MRNTWFKSGLWNAICDRCGFRYKNTELQQDWQGLMVCKTCWEPRHPQEMIRPIPDQNKLPWTRPEGTDISVGDLSPLYIVSLATSEAQDFVAPQNYEVATTTLTVTAPISGIIVIEPGVVITTLTIDPPTSSPMVDAPTEIIINNSGAVSQINNNTGGLTVTTRDAGGSGGGTAFALVVRQQPTTTIINNAISPSVTVEVRNSDGTLASFYNNGQISVALGSNPGSATLSGTLSKSVVAGVATFDDLQLDQTGVGYTLTFQFLASGT